MTKRYSCRYDIYPICRGKKAGKTGYVDYDECLKCFGKAIQSIQKLLANEVIRLGKRIAQLEREYAPVCLTCGRTFKSIRGLRIHRRVVHAKQE